MIAIGLCYLPADRQGASQSISINERIAPMLCAYGLIAELVAAGAVYVICVYIWGNFYFTPIETGKNVWLIGQGLRSPSMWSASSMQSPASAGRQSNVDDY